MYGDQELKSAGTQTQLKRKRSDLNTSNGSMAPPAPPGDDTLSGARASSAPSAAVTNFRTVSACNRCRTRKNRCDQKLPACSGCEKSGTPCVGFDPVLNREIPRNYVMYLESRINTLETILSEHGLPFPPATELAITTQIIPQTDPPAALPPPPALAAVSNDHHPAEHVLPPYPIKEEEQVVKRERSFTGVEKPSTTAISFASVVREAVRRHIAPNGRGHKNGKDQVKDIGNHTDTFFGLYAPPSVKPAPFPDAQLARDLSRLYFEHANPQIPILHRGEFNSLLDRVYSRDLRTISARASFLINITCAIGSGVIMDRETDQEQQQSTDEQISTHYGTYSIHGHAEPEQYYAAAVACLDTFNSAPRAIESTPNGLEELQALLLVSYYAVQRPVAPGLWYIAGTAMRLAKILGLYHEAPEENMPNSDGIQSTISGRQFWTRDMRRRLWYCTYSIDRLVSLYVGRPTSIDETVITTPFPSHLDDIYITPNGVITPTFSPGSNPPSYKLVSYHYFRLRLLQSEIMQVLESRRAQFVRARGAAHLTNPYLLGDLPEPFLGRFNGDFRRWRADMDDRLLSWKNEVPSQHETGVKFNSLFFDLNYWQTVVILYRHSLPVPQELAGELDETTLEESKTARYADAEDIEDEQVVYQKAGVAGQAVIRIYRQLHVSRLVNYTYLAVHHIFVCGVSFLYSIWQSPLVRQSLQPEDIDLTVYAATTVLTALIPKCKPAQSARDAFKRMSKVTMAFYTASMRQGISLHNRVGGPMTPSSLPTPPRLQQRAAMPRRAPQFDTNFKSLFSEEEMSLRSPEFPLPKKYRPVFEPRRAALAALPASDSPSVPIGALLEGSDVPITTYSPQQQKSPYAGSTGSEGQFMDDAFWEAFYNDPENAGWAMDGPMGLELGFGAGGQQADGGQWGERGFEMLDGWLLGGTGGGDDGL